MICPPWIIRISEIAVATMLLAFIPSFCVAQPSKNGDIALQRLSLPRGPGSIEGLGESFESDLSTGSARYAVQFDIPGAASGFSPKLSLQYDSNQGFGSFGVGWSLMIESVQRQTDKGIPLYDESDTFISGGEELVELENGDFFQENSRSYARYRKFGSGWEKTSTNGVCHFFGLEEQSKVSQPTGRSKFDETFKWLIESSVDLHGNRIEYGYDTLEGSIGVKYLKSIRYGMQKKSAKTYYEVVFEYEKSLSPSISFCSRFERSRQHVCGKVAVNAVVDGNVSNIRNYNIQYHPQPVRIPLIQSVTQTDANGTKLPPSEFGYSASTFNDSPNKSRFAVANPGLPVGLTNDDVTFCDMNSDGLTDICYSRPGYQWKVLINKGGLAFRDSVDFSTGNLSLRDPETQLIDVTGDGRVDLVFSSPDSGNQIVKFQELDSSSNGNVSRSLKLGEIQEFANECAINFASTGVRFFDVDFNKCVDVARILDDSLVVATNVTSSNGVRRWTQRKIHFSESYFPDDSMSPTMRLADINGDRLMDFVDVFEREGSVSVTCYYGTGEGRFSPPTSIPFASGKNLLDSGEFESANLSTFHFSDVNADGLSDIVQAAPGNVRVWASRGNFFEEPVDWEAPNYRSGARILIQDMNGNGSNDIVVFEVDAEGGQQLKVLDCFPEGRGNLLTQITNGIGKKIEITYRSATDYYLAADNKTASWTSLCPLPTHVVGEFTRTNSLDLNGDDKPDLEVTNFVYANPYYDGREKQFRGFADVTRIDHGVDLKQAKSGTATAVTRFRFHTGRPDQSDNNANGIIDEFNYVAGAEEEPFKGRIIWEEVCGIEAMEVNSDFTYCWPIRTGGKVGFGDVEEDGVDKKFGRDLAHNELVYRRKVNKWKSRLLHGSEEDKGREEYPFATRDKFRVVRDIQLEHEYSQQIEGPNVALLPVEEQLRFTPRVTKKSYVFNSFGGRVSKTEFGIVDDLETTRWLRRDVIEYAHKGIAVDNWLLDQVARQTTRKPDGSLVAGKKFRYGNKTDSFEVLDLFFPSKRGLKIRTEAMLIDDSQSGIPIAEMDDEKHWVSRSTESFDDFGNVIWMLDGEADEDAPEKGHSRRFTYDSIFNNYPVTESIFIDSNTKLQAKASFDVGFGVMTELVDFSLDEEVTIQERIGGIPVGDEREVTGFQTSLVYDSHGRLTSLIRPGDSNAHPTEVYTYIPADPANKLQYTYDQDGKLSLETIDDGNWEVSLGSQNGTIKLESGLSAVVTQKREEPGKEFTTGFVTLTDGMGRELARACENDSTKALFLKSVLLDSRGNDDRLVQPHESSVGWSPKTVARRQLVKRDPLGRQLSVSHPPDFNNFVASTRTIYLPFTERSYDEEDNLAGGKHEGTYIEYETDGLERLSQVREYVRLDAKGNSTVKLNFWTTKYSYDLLDNLVQITDSQENISYHRYDSLSRRRAVNDPNRGKSKLDYDFVDNVVSIEDARGATIKYEFDGANRKLKETAALAGGVPQTISYHYDKPKDGVKGIDGSLPQNCFGKLSWIEDLCGEEHFSYSSRGLVNWTLRRIEHDGNFREYYRKEEFDSQDRRVAQTLKSHGDAELTIITNHNRRGLVKSYLNDGKKLVGLTYHPNGVGRETEYANKTKKTVELDHRLRLQSLLIEKTGVAAEQLINYSYSFDQASNLLQVDDQRPVATVPLGDHRRNSQRYTLDDAYRLRSAQFFSSSLDDAPATLVNYSFDQIGNQLEKTADGALPDDEYWKRGLGKADFGKRSKRDGSKLGKAGPNALLSSSKGASLRYDAGGDVNEYDGKTLVRDAWGRISNVFNGDIEVAKYRYSHSGQRIVRHANDLVFYPFAEVRDSHTNGQRLYLLDGESRLVCFEKNSSFFQFRNHVNSLLLTTDKQGRTHEELSYFPYGAVLTINTGGIDSFQSSFRFSSNERDIETGLHFFRNRYLTSGLGRFLSCDPVLIVGKHAYARNPISQNAYLYANANPGRFVDPNGDVAIAAVPYLAPPAIAGMKTAAAWIGGSVLAIWLADSIHQVYSKESEKGDDWKGGPSTTIAKGEAKQGRKWRVDVEKPRKGKNKGDVHVQIKGKGIRKGVNDEFPIDKPNDINEIPFKDIRKNPKVQKGIMKGLEMIQKAHKNNHQ